MINICPQCRRYSTDREIDPEGPAAICPFCGYRTPFLRLPLLVITGASGTGKSTIYPHLPARIPGCVFLESDFLIGSFSELVPKFVWSALTWLSHLALPAGGRKTPKTPATPGVRRDGRKPGMGRPVYAYRNIWLRIVKNIHQSGRPVVLSVRAIPDHFEGCPERKFLGNIHYLALVCSQDELENRIKNRYPKIVARMLALNEWYKTNASLTDPEMTLIDTTGKSTEETTEAVAGWIREILARENLPACGK